jgi:hypothetical protein
MKRKRAIIFHGKPVAIDFEGISNNNLTTNPIVAPDLRKKMDPDLLKGVGHLLMEQLLKISIKMEKELNNNNK